MSSFILPNKRVLITGGAGFLGFHLTKIRLLKKVLKYYPLTIFIVVIKGNIFELQKFENFEFQRIDVKSKLTFKVDYIFNLACPASPVHYQKDPVETITTCIQGAIKLIKLS